MTAVVPYAFCALAGSLVSARVSGGTRIPRVTVVEIIAFVFAMFTLYGCGAELCSTDSSSCCWAFLFMSGSGGMPDPASRGRDPVCRCTF